MLESARAQTRDMRHKRRECFVIQSPFKLRPVSRWNGAWQLLSLATAEQTRSTQGTFQKFDSLQVFEAVFRVAEAIQFDAHAVHEREVKAARLTVLVAGLNVIQRAARLESAAESAG